MTAPGQTAGLPATIPDGARIYLRPVGLSCGNAAEKFLAAGRAARLAAGPWVFAACEVALRTPEGVRRTVAGVREIETWAAGLPEAWRNAARSRLELLTLARRDAAGRALHRPLIMGIVNATPDSFSDGGAHLDPRAAIDHGRYLAACGADILDIGGESTRPGALPVEPDVEAARVMPVLEGLAAAGSELGPTLLSVDTRHAEVMARALGAGARIVNDVTALAGDPRSLATVAASDATAVLMHMRGTPDTMNLDPDYEDAALDIFDFLEDRVNACLAAGVPRDRLIVDPGIGFGKSGDDNLAILRSVALYHGLGCPILIGVSRKGLTGAHDRAYAPRDRLPGSLSAAVKVLDQGVQILRVHDVAETRQALDVWERLVGLAGRAAGDG